MTMWRYVSVFGLVLVASCASGDGTVSVDAEYNLRCPAGTGVECGALGDTCLGPFGQRTLIGADGDESCSCPEGDESCTSAPLDVTCRAIRSGERILIELGASVVENGALGEIYGLELDVILDADSMERCNVTIIEDGAAFEFGGCVFAPEPTTVERPCQLSNFTTGAREVAFDLECRPNPILNIAAFGFNVGAVDSASGPATISFSNCSGL
jgi:hypothetical protein